MEDETPATDNPDTESLVLPPDDEDSLWKRSKSDASFFLPNLTPQATKNSAQSGNVSEISKVYWDIPEAVEASDTITTSPQFPRTLTSEGDASLQNNEIHSTVRKSEKSVKSGTSQIHVHHVHFRDGHARSKPLIAPVEDEFCRRQSTPVAPYPAFAGNMSTVRTDSNRANGPTGVARPWTRSNDNSNNNNNNNRGITNGVARSVCPASSGTGSRRIAQYQTTSNSSSTLATNQSDSMRIRAGSMSTEPRDRSVSPVNTSWLMRIRSADSFSNRSRPHYPVSHTHRWGEEFSGPRHSGRWKADAKTDEDKGERGTSDDNDDTVFSSSLEELQRSLFDQLEKLKSLNSATFYRSQRRCEVDNARSEDAGVKAADVKSLSKQMTLMDEQCEALNNCTRLLNEAHESADQDAECMVWDLFKREGLIGQLLERLAEPLVDSPGTDGTDRIQHTFVHASSTSASSTSYSATTAVGESTRTKKSAAIAATTANYQTTKDKQNEELAVDSTISVREGQSCGTMDRQVVIRSAELLSQILSYENLDSLLNHDLESTEPSDQEDNVCDAQGMSLSKEEQTVRLEQRYRRVVTNLSDDRSTHNHIQFQAGSESASTPTGTSPPTSPSYLNTLLQRVIRRTWDYREDVDIYRAYMAVIEPLLKHTESICHNVVDSGGLRILVHACRSNDVPTLRHAALGLANLALFGGADSQSEMMRQHAVDWLFRLAFYPDNVIQYFACLASVVLSTNPKLASSVSASGTLDLVLPFVRTHRPVEFARGQLIAAFSCACMHKQQTQLTTLGSAGPNGSNGATGRGKPTANCGKCYAGASKNWLERLLPALEGQRREARVLAAFHFAVEATLKSDTKQTEIFYTTDAVKKLCNLACNLDPLESELAALALHLLGEPVPYRLTPHVPLWTPEDVQCWLDRAGFGNLVSKFSELQVDGDLLLRLNESTLCTDLGVQNGITRSQLLRELNRLKCEADYSSLDSSDLAGWLDWANGLVPTRISGSDVAESMLSSVTSSTNTNVSTSAALVPMTTSSTLSTSLATYPSHCPQLPRWNASTSLVQYTYGLLAAGVDRSFLPMLTDSSLAQDCHVSNAIHRARILSAVQTYLSPRPLANLSNGGNSEWTLGARPLDCFISYRRSNGSALASLLKVHLQLRGYRVFFDIDRLSAGIFKESLFHSIQTSQNFLLVLSPHALDRCVNDVTNADWIHREIACALQNKCNIIPITYEFIWPDAEQLPEDIRPVTEYNAVNWIHEYQDACIDKVEKFMVKPPEKVRNSLWQSPPQLQQHPLSPVSSPAPCPGQPSPLADYVQDSKNS